MNKRVLFTTVCLILSMAINLFLFIPDRQPSNNSGLTERQIPEGIASANEASLLPPKPNEKIPITTQLPEVPTQLDIDVAMKTGDPADVHALKEPLDRGATMPLTALNNQYEAENYDVDWAPMMEAQTLDQFYARDISGSDIASVGCRETLCKIHITHHDEKAKFSFHEALFEQIHGVEGVLFHSRTVSGEWETLIYRMR